MRSVTVHSTFASKACFLFVNLFCFFLIFLFFQLLRIRFDDTLIFI